ncbi:MAG: phosphate starvation protein PhoH [Bacteroidia bacterium]|nr:MAG: phosphate starvation protein PhoH [Bacteroidia bacterium]
MTILFFIRLKKINCNFAGKKLVEKIVVLDIANPVEVLGVNDEKLNVVRQHFPDLKIIARGNEIKVIGDKQIVYSFEKKWKQIVKYYDDFGFLTLSVIESLLNNPPENKHSDNGAEVHSNIILYGNNGIVIKARTPNQKKLVAAVEKHDVVFAIGPAGSGKTYTAVALAVRSLKNKQVKRIILTRPAVEAGENLGFLPGDLKEKLDPYMQPIYDALADMIPADKLQLYIENRTIQIAPLAFMRGRTLDNAFVILDEAQNTTQNQMKMFLTRMGNNAKFVITGDITQIDLPSKQPSGLLQSIQLLKEVDGICILHLNEADIVRHPLVKKILEQYKSIER